MISLDAAGSQAIIKVSGHQHRWLAGGYDPGRMYTALTLYNYAGSLSHSVTIFVHQVSTTAG